MSDTNEKQGLHVNIHELLLRVRDGAVSPEEAERQLAKLPYEDLDFAKIDHHRTVRNGFGEVIYCAGKRTDHLEQILARYVEQKINVLATRVSKVQGEHLTRVFPELSWDQTAATLCLQPHPPVPEGKIMICTGGTSDIPIAAEAAATAAFFGAAVESVYDVGVAGIHRLFDKLERIRQANVIIAVAGMEGALGSVIGGLVDKPVICLPTSVGYGASFGGLAALLTMLNSCAEGLAVVNIDNGFGAGYLAAQINRLAVRGSTRAPDSDER